MNELLRDSESPRGNGSVMKPIRQKENRGKVVPLRGREVFLTDTQTDQTKSSN